MEVILWAPPGIDSLELRTRRWLIERDSKPGNAYVGVPHRLDRPASGALVLAKHVRAARRLGKQFQERTVHKLYWAVVEGKPQAESGTWTDYMRKIPDVAKSEIVDESHEQAKLARLNYRTLGFADGLALIEIELETGRTHQIRLQAASRGLPIAGDTLYGSTKPFGPQSTDLRKRWIALHARQITVEHPMTRKPLSAVAPLSDHWEPFDGFADVLFPSPDQVE